MALNAQILLSILAHESDAGDISRTLRATPTTYALALTNGTGANQAQVVWSDARTVPAGGQDDVILTNLTDDRGSVAFTAVKALYIRSTHATQSVQMVLGDGIQGSWLSGPGYASDSGCTGEVNIAAGGCLFFSDPTAAGAGVQSGATIVITGAPGATYDIVLIGEGTIT
jgi:hypothetical protein